MDIKKIYEKLEKLLMNSYSPYSKFKVCCIVESEEGNFYSGVNYENVSLSATVCAERNAIGAMITNGDRSIRSVYILTTSESFIPPCGICLQTISEFMKPKGFIILFNRSMQYKQFYLETLLPHRFNKRDLKNE